MAAVDPYDDSIERFVAFHYRFDPERHERRNVIVGAFDNRRELRDFMTQAGDDLRAATMRGEAESVEGLSGTRWHIGYHAGVANRRLLHPKRRTWRPF